MDSSSSIPSKNLNTRMTSEEMINKSSEWTLGCDNALLNRLKDFSNNLVSQAERITKECDSLGNEVDLLQSRVESVSNDFLMLANTQYVENRVEEFEERNPIGVVNKSQESRVKTKAEKEAELMGRMKEAIQIGLKTNSYHRCKAEVANGIQELKINRSHIIGTPKFFSSKYCGLVDESENIPGPSLIFNDQVNLAGSNTTAKTISQSPSHLTQPPGSGLEYSQIFGEDSMTFKRECSMSSDDLSFGRKSPVSSRSESNSFGHSEAAQPSNSTVPNQNVPTNLVEDLNKVLRSKIPPPQIESDSEDDFKPPAPGQEGRQLFADPEDDDDFFGSSSMYPSNRYIDNEDDDFFDAPPKLPTTTVVKETRNVSVPQVSPAIVKDEEIPKSILAIPEVRPDQNSAVTRTFNSQIQPKTALNFSAVINQIKSVSKDKSHSESHSNPMQSSNKVASDSISDKYHPECFTRPVQTRHEVKVASVTSDSVKRKHHPESHLNLTQSNDKVAPDSVSTWAGGPPSAKINSKPESEPHHPIPTRFVQVETNSTLETKENLGTRKLYVPKLNGNRLASNISEHKQKVSEVKVKQSIFDDSDSDDLFSSASSSSSKLKGNISQPKDNLFTDSARSLSSAGGGSSLFGGDEIDDNGFGFTEKHDIKSSNDSLPNKTVNPKLRDNETSKVQTQKIFKPTKVSVRKSIFDESDSDDDLFSKKTSITIHKKTKTQTQNGLFNPVIKESKSTKPISVIHSSHSINNTNANEQRKIIVNSSEDIHPTTTTIVPLPTVVAEDSDKQPVVPVSEVKTKNKLSIFHDSDDDFDLFSPKTSKVVKNAKSRHSLFSISPPSQKFTKSEVISKSDTTNTNSEKIVKPECKVGNSGENSGLREGPTTGKVKGKSIFEASDSDDDLFSSRRSKTVTQAKTQDLFKPVSLTPTPVDEVLEVDFKCSDDILKDTFENDIGVIEIVDSVNGDDNSNPNSTLLDEPDKPAPSPELTNVQKLGLSLKINPLALKPSSTLKPPTALNAEVPSSFVESPVDSDSLLNCIAKQRVKIQKPRRLPTRKPKNVQTEDPIFGLINSEVDVIFNEAEVDSSVSRSIERTEPDIPDYVGVSSSEESY